MFHLGPIGQPDAGRVAPPRPLTTWRARTRRVGDVGGVALLRAPQASGSRASRRRSGALHRIGSIRLRQGVTPGLGSRVARQAALCPPLDFAEQELQRVGLKLDVKTIRRITYQCGESLLRLRRHAVRLWQFGRRAVATPCQVGRFRIDNFMPRSQNAAIPARTSEVEYLRWAAEANRGYRAENHLPLRAQLRRRPLSA